MIGLGMFDGVFSDLDGVAIALFGVDGDIDLRCEHLELFDSCRTVHVAGHEQRTLGFLAFQLFGQFA